MLRFEKILACWMSYGAVECLKEWPTLCFRNKPNQGGRTFPNVLDDRLAAIQPWELVLRPALTKLLQQQKKKLRTIYF